MRLKFAIFTVSFVILFSCTNDKQTNYSDIKLDIDPLTNNNNNSNTNDRLINIIKQIPDSLLPDEIIRNINTLSKNGKFSLYYQTKAFNSKKFYKIEEVNDFDTKTFGIYIFTRNQEGFKSYFYFIQQNDFHWQNITKKVISQSVIDFYNDNLNMNLKFGKLKNNDCAVTNLSNKGIIYDLNQNVVYTVDTTYSWQKTANIVVYKNQIFISEFQQNEGILNDDDQQFLKKYNDVQEAINDSINVYYADFSNLGLNKLTSQIGSLKNIEVLILDYNKLSSLPFNIYKLEKLKIINCNNNKLESLPDNIGLLPNLEELSASSNYLTTLPSSLSKASKIQSLNFSNNKIRSFYLDCSNLKNLSILNLSNNSISSLPYTIGNLKNLISLDISDNPIEFLPKTIFNLKNLKYINIKNTKIHDSVVVRLMDSFPDANISIN